ncbi:MAG: hypothetical protein ACNA8R_07830 [Nitriliruptoraceae bacterium]
MGTTESRNSRPPGAPKGRPTPGRKQRNAAARARARREQLTLRLWWAGGSLVLVGLIAALVLTGTGAGNLTHVVP